MKLPDVNVLLYALNESDPRHAEASGWLAGALASEPVGFAWPVLLGVLRLTTRAEIFPRPLTVAEASAVIDAWTSASRAVIVEPTGRHLGVLTGLLTHVGSGGNLVPDAHLAALAIEHHATVVSYDRDFGRFPGVRWSRPGGD